MSRTPGRMVAAPVLIALIATTTATPATVHAQGLNELRLLDESSVRIDGTSNQSDWTVDATVMSGRLWVRISEDGLDPDSVVFKVSSPELKSGRSPIMDRLMYDALNTTEHPEIAYALGPAGVEPAPAVEDTLYWNTVGLLTLVGVTDTVSTIVAGYRDADGRLVFSGTYPMSMRDYGITPPTALFGALRTREDVTIRFRLVFGDE